MVMLKDRVRYKTFDQLSFADVMVYSKLPDHPFWSNIEHKIDFSFADTLCSVLYSGRGQYPFAPSLKLKVHLIQTYYRLSDRLVEERIIGDLFIKRFLGLPVNFFGFDHSTIGLDRSRMGSAMLHACHLYILAQMHRLDLWGDQNEQWIIDSFPAQVALSKMSGYRLIQKGMTRICQQLKRSHPALYKFTRVSVAWDAMFVRLTKESSESEKRLAFSKLVAQAYGLLQWFQLEDVAALFQEWPNPQAQQKSRELQAVLKQILVENSRGAVPEEEDSSHPGDPPPPAGSGIAQPRAMSFEKIPFKDRSTRRIISVTDPGARWSIKNGTTLQGYKIQNLATPSGVLLNTRVVSAVEHDRDAMFDVVKEVKDFFGITPSAVLGDSAYGHGPQRLALGSLHIQVVAPVTKSNNTVTGLYNLDRFTYDREPDRYVCPNNQTSTRKAYTVENRGTQYFFGTSCKSCPLRTECPPSQKGRTAFRSDFHDICAAADTFNESEEGRLRHRFRFTIERKNQELKNDCAVGRLQTRSTPAARMKAALAMIVVNLKHTLRHTIAPKPGFLRRVQLV